MGEQAMAAMMFDINRSAGELLGRAGAWSTKFIGDATMAPWLHPTNGLSRCDVLIARDVFRSLIDARFVPEGMIEVDLKGYDQRFPALGFNFADIGTFVGRLLAA